MLPMSDLRKKSVGVFKNVSQNKLELSGEDIKQKETLLMYISDAEQRIQQKVELFKRNNAYTKRRPDSANVVKLDSSLKKNTAFVRKLTCQPFVDVFKRNLTASQLDTLLKDLAHLNLSKYLSEVATALVEVKLKVTDIPAAVQLCSELHSKYAEFSPTLLEHWIKTFSIKKDEPITNPSKLRVDLRFYGELVAAGLFPLRESLPLLGTVLTVLTSGDKEQHRNTSIVLSFCKHCGEDFAGLVPQNIRILSERFKIPVTRSTILSAEKQTNVRSLFKDYYLSLCQHLTKEHNKLLSFERQNEQIMKAKGELRADRVSQWEELKADLQALLNSTASLAESLDEEVPELQSASPEIGLTDLDDRSVWEDEATQQFYQELPNLQEYLPALNKEKSTSQLPQMTEEKLDEDLKDEDFEPDEIQKEEEDTEPEAATSVALLETFFQHLPNCVNQGMIDNAAIEFLIYINSKHARRKLISVLFGVPRTRVDLLPFYGRFVAILAPAIPEIATRLIHLLKQDFKYHMRKKDQMNLESKIKVVHYIGELVKFGLYSRLECLYCLKLLLHDFTHHHIEMACGLLETCGRYLYRNPHTHQRTKLYLEQMMRLKAAVVLDCRYATMIENAFYHVSPPENAPFLRKVRPPMHEFLRKLIFQDLMLAEKSEYVLELMRKVDWDCQESAAYAIKCLTSAWEVKFYRIPALANLVACLVEFQEFVGSRVVDGVLEDIRLGLEVNIPLLNQRRVAMVKYLGELYNYRLVESNDIFRVLYSLISFGISFKPDDFSPLDPPESLFRLRLVFLLLNVCSYFFSYTDPKAKLSYYFIYLQKYYWFKHSLPVWGESNKFPISVEQLFSDVQEVVSGNNNGVPSLPAKNFDEAAAAVKQLEEELKAQYYTKIQLETGSLSTITEGCGTERNEGDGEFQANEASTALPTSLCEKVMCRADAEFLQALDQMISDNVQDRMRDAVKTQQTDISVPIHARTNRTAIDDNFVLLLRKGNKQQCKSLTMPIDSELALSLKSREAAERQEKEKVKRLTLDINKRLQEEDYQNQLAQEAITAINLSHQRRLKYPQESTLPEIHIINKKHQHQ